MSVIDRFGRKKLLLTGTVGLAICLTMVSYVFITHKHLDWLVWLLMAYIACFAISQGAVVWVYISEVFPNRVRSKGQALGSSSHWVTNAIISLIFPVMAGSSGAYPFIFFAVMMVLDFFLILKYYPETKGISLEQMQHRFGID
jgi:MFS family permease